MVHAHKSTYQDNTPDSNIVCALSAAHKWFGSTHAVDNVSINFRAGEIHAVLGENGAGKSTIGKMVGGLVAPDEGKLFLDGVETKFTSIADAQKRGVAVVFQELSLVPDLTVRENIFLGKEAGAHPMSFIKRKAEVDACSRLLERFGFHFDLDTRVRDLSTANQQLVEIVKALARGPKLLVMDEPTAMLGVLEKRKLLRIMRDLRDKGVAIIFVTHHVDEVLEVSDCVSLMRDGSLVDSFRVTPETSADFVIEKLVGGRERKASLNRKGSVGPLVLQMSGLPSRTGHTEVSIHRGQIVGLYGVVGSGTERIGLGLAGLEDIHPARMHLSGTPYRPKTPSQAAKRGVSYLPSGRVANCIFPNRSIRENLMVSQLRRSRRWGMLDHGREHGLASDQLSEFRTRYSDLDDAIISLSGGNQQKVILGRALGRDGEILVLEDPTAGVDIGSKEDIYEMIRMKTSGGLGVLLVSSDLLETILMCDVIYTVSNGEIVSKYENPVLDDEQRIISDVLGSSVQGSSKQ